MILKNGQLMDRHYQAGIEVRLLPDKAGKCSGADSRSKWGRTSGQAACGQRSIYA